MSHWIGEADQQLIHIFSENTLSGAQTTFEKTEITRSTQRKQLQTLLKPEILNTTRTST
jgi:hypothetical protein